MWNEPDAFLRSGTPSQICVGGKPLELSLILLIVAGKFFSGAGTQRGKSISGYKDRAGYFAQHQTCTSSKFKARFSAVLNGEDNKTVGNIEGVW